MTNTTNNAAQPSEDAVERVARAIRGAAGFKQDWSKVSLGSKETARRQARAALAAMPAQPSVEAMVEAAWREGFHTGPDGNGDADESWLESDARAALATITEAPERKDQA